MMAILLTPLHLEIGRGSPGVKISYPYPYPPIPLPLVGVEGYRRVGVRVFQGYEGYFKGMKGR
jgi:hypothetical protein